MAHRYDPERKEYVQIVDARIINPEAIGGSGGDMKKEVYDTNDDGKVDAAEAADSVPWGGVTGKPSTFPPASHTHPISEVTDLQTALDSKAPTSHTHTIAQVTDLQTALDGKMAANVADSVAPIDDTASATAEDVADKINELIAALQG